MAEQGPPAEAAADSVQWCREQFVVSAWQPLLGPEGRPVDPADPQLHRSEFRAPPGVVTACGGVGMPPLTIRIDPAQWIRSWVESGPRVRILRSGRTSTSVRMRRAVELDDRRESSLNAEVVGPGPRQAGPHGLPGGAVSASTSSAADPR